MKPLYKDIKLIFLPGLFFLLDFFQITIINSIAPFLKSSFKMGDFSLGLLSSSYLFGVVLFSVPMGKLLDKYKTKYIFLGALAGYIICIYGFTVSHSFYMVFFCRFAAGALGVCGFLAPTLLIARQVSVQRRTTCVGGLIVIAMFGALLAQTPAELLIQTFGWRAPLYMSVLLGIIIWLVNAWLFEVNWNTHKVIEANDKFRNIIKNKINIVCSLFTCLMNSSLLVFGAAFGSSLLLSAQGITRTDSSLASSLVFFGFMIGALLMGPICSLLNDIRRLLICAAIISFISIVLLTFNRNMDVWSIFICCFLLGVTSATQIVSYPIISIKNPPTIIATAEGFINTVVIAGGGLFQLMYGWLSAQAHVVNLSLAGYLLPATFLLSILFVKLMPSISLKQQNHTQNDMRLVRN